MILFIPLGGIDAAEARGIDPPPDPMVLFLTVAQEAGQLRREDRCLAEVRLALEQVTVSSVRAPVAFISSSINERIAWLRPVINQHSAEAAVWLEPAGDASLTLYLVTLATGRAFLRVVEASSGPAAESELALALQELLGQAYLLGPKRESDPVIPVEENALIGDKQSVDDQVADHFRLSAGTLLTTGGGIAKHSGPSWRLGCGLTGEIWLSGATHLRVSFAVSRVPISVKRKGSIGGWAVGGEVGVGYSWRFGHIGIGPFLTVGGIRSATWIDVDAQENQTFSWWDLRGAAGVSLHLWLAERASIVLMPSLGVHGKQRNYLRDSDNSLIFSTPVLDWQLATGLQFRF